MKGKGFKPETIERMHAKRAADMARLESIVLDALMRLGGRFQGRVMAFRRHLAVSLREAQIKEALKRLSCQDKVRIIGERNSAKGNTYEVIQ
mgnify:CR=1 FL=1